MLKGLVMQAVLLFPGKTYVDTSGYEAQAQIPNYCVAVK